MNSRGFADFGAWAYGNSPQLGRCNSAPSPPKPRGGPSALAGAREAGRSGSMLSCAHTRSLCAESPAQSEQFCCSFSRRRSDRLRGDSWVDQSPAEIPATDPELLIPPAAAQTRSVSVATCAPEPTVVITNFKYLAREDISEFESYHPSHAVGLCRWEGRSLWRALRFTIVAAFRHPFTARLLSSM